MSGESNRDILLILEILGKNEVAGITHTAFAWCLITVGVLPRMCAFHCLQTLGWLLNSTGFKFPWAVKQNSQKSR